MNISNKIKNNIINHESVSKETSELFLEYMIHKAIVITDRMYHYQGYKPIYLFKEICYSYNLMDEAYDDKTYSIVNVGGYKYLVDFEFHNNKISKLCNNKYIEYDDKILDKYLNLLKEENDNG